MLSKSGNDASLRILAICALLSVANDVLWLALAGLVRRT